MRHVGLACAVALCALPRGAHAEEPTGSELPAPAAEADGGDGWLEDGSDAPPPGESDELPEPEPVREPEEPAAPAEPVERPRKARDDDDERTVRTNEYGLPVPGPDAVHVRLVPKLPDTSVRIISRADGVKKHEGIHCDEPCLLTLEPGEYGVQVWQDGKKVHGRKLRIQDDAEYTVGPANRPVAWAGFGVGVAGLAAAYAGLFVGEFFIGAHGDGSSAGGTRSDVGLGLILGGLGAASIGFPIFITKMRASVEERPLDIGESAREASRFDVASDSSARVTGLSGGVQF